MLSSSASNTLGATTTHYPSKFYTIEYQGAGTTTATSTSYIWHGDTLVAYIEQPLADGVATGTPTTYYVHPDHLGSTNVVTDENGDVVEAIDYYPYGAERIHSGSADADRTFIGQFGDDATALSYLNARYYDGGRGQFLSEDPVFWEVGGTPSGKLIMVSPQLANSYAYAADNPIAGKDADGRLVELVTRPVMERGGHAFILITNTPANAAKLVGVPANVQDSTRITLGGYATVQNALFVNTGNLVKGANRPDDYNLSESQYYERTQILPPAQYNGNQTAFENAILESYNKLDDDLGAYSFFGIPQRTGQGNSNNTATSILSGAGVDRGFTQGYRPTTMHPYLTPGLGTSLPASQKQSLVNKLQGLVKTLTAIRDKLKSN